MSESVNHQMNVLIVFYSRSGITRRLAHRLAEGFDGHNCCIEQVIDLKDRSGLIGILKSGVDALLGNLTRIESPREYPSDYDLVLVGTPVWAGTLAPAIRTYLSQFGRSSKKVACFCTLRCGGANKTFRRLRQFFKCDPLACLAVKNREVRADKFDDQVNEFVAGIKSALASGGD